MLLDLELTPLVGCEIGRYRGPGTSSRRRREIRDADVRSAPLHRGSARTSRLARFCHRVRWNTIVLPKLTMSKFVLSTYPGLLLHCAYPVALSFLLSPLFWVVISAISQISNTCRYIASAFSNKPLKAIVGSSL